MRYHNFQRTDVRLPRGYPVLAHIIIDSANWLDFERLVGDTPVTKIVGNSPCEDERMVVHVACASTSVLDRLRDGWE